jgi:hypothetical protein
VCSSDLAVLYFQSSVVLLGKHFTNALAEVWLGDFSRRQVQRRVAVLVSENYLRIAVKESLDEFLVPLVVKRGSRDGG